MLLAPGHAFALPIWPKVELPADVQTFDVGGDFLSNGMPTRATGFISPRGTSAVADWFNSHPATHWSVERMQEATVLGRAEGKHFITIKLTPVRNGTKGLVSIVDMAKAAQEAPRLQARLAQWMSALPSGTRVMNHIASNDAGRLLEGEIKSRFATNVVQERKFSELLGNVIKRYQNRSIETAQVMEELVEMAKKFREAASRGESLGLSDDEVKFYDALITNESAVRELSDETLKKIAHELTESLRQNISVDWAQRESVRAKLRLMVKRILRKYKYPPDYADAAVDLVLQQAETIGEEWV